MKKAVKNIIVFMVAVLMVAYFGYKIYQTTFPSYSFEDAIKYTLNEKLYKDSFVVRSEEIIKENAAGVRSYMVQNGTRVSKNSPVLSIYNNEDEALIAKRINKIDEEIKILESIETSNVNISTGDFENAKKLLKEDLKKLSKNIETGSYSSIEQNKSTILYLLNKKQIIIGDAENFDNRIRELKSEKNSLVSDQREDPVLILSPGTGYFISDIDGYEDAVSIENINELTPQKLNTLLNSKPNKKTDSSIGKLVKDYHWYICVNISKEEANKIEKQGAFTINIPSLSLSNMEVSVQKINYDSQRENAVLILKCKYMSTDLSTLRMAKIEINLKSYSGIRINSRAIHFESQKNEEGEDEQVKGVYVLVGSQIKFKKVNEIYTGKGYILSKLGDQGNSYVKPYDKIVTDGKDLYDGKFIK